MVKPSMRRGACIYVEGAEREDLRRAAREAFSKLFATTLGRRKPSFIFCGSRLEAFNQFRDHLELRRDEAALLVVDAEEVVESSTRWEHVRTRKGDGWQKPKGTTESDLRFMSVVMESWCIADAFPKRPLERIPKDEVFATLKKKGWTKEGANSFLLVKRSPEFRALCDRLRELSS